MEISLSLGEGMETRPLEGKIAFSLEKRIVFSWEMKIFSLVMKTFSFWVTMTSSSVGMGIFFSLVMETFSSLGKVTFSSLGMGTFFFLEKVTHFFSGSRAYYMFLEARAKFFSAEIFLCLLCSSWTGRIRDM